MDWPQAIEALGGGVPAVVIVALAWAWFWERRRNAELQDRRIADQKEHTAQIVESIRTLESAMSFLERR